MLDLETPNLDSCYQDPLTDRSDTSERADGACTQPPLLASAPQCLGQAIDCLFAIIEVVARWLMPSSHPSSATNGHQPAHNDQLGS